jgi:hypothetical protein
MADVQAETQAAADEMAAAARIDRLIATKEEHR